MARNAIKSDLRSSKMATTAILQKKEKLRIDLKWCENVIESDFLPFCKQIPKKEKLIIDLKWWEMRSKFIFGHPKWLPVAILWKNSKKLTVAYWSKMARNAIKSDFRSSKCNRKWYFRSFKMDAGGYPVYRIWKKIAYWNDEKSDRKFKEIKSCVLI